MKLSLVFTGGDGHTHSFNSTDADLMLLLPACIREQYPLQLTAKFGLSSDVADLVLSSAPKGQSFSSIHNSLTELHQLKFLRAELGFVGALHYYLKEGVKPHPRSQEPKGVAPRGIRQL